MKKTSIAAPGSARKRTHPFIAAAAVIATAVLANYLVARNVPSVDPTVSIERSQRDESLTPQTAGAMTNLPDDGEVYRTADRLREASALALAAALRAAIEQANGRPVHSADQLIVGIQSAGLLPPGTATDGATKLRSKSSSLLIRFRPEPLAVEILSLPRSRDDGPALMVRIPSLGDDRDHGSLFIAERLGEIAPPAPFASLPDCVRAGWIDQSFNLADVPEAQWQQLLNWLATRRPH